MNPVWIVFGLLVLVFLYEFARACMAEYHDYRASNTRQSAADDEWLARQNIAPLSSAVDRVWNAK